MMSASRTAVVSATLLLTFGAVPSIAQVSLKDFKPVPAAAPPEPNALPLYPDQKPANLHESWTRFGDDYIVRNVTQPTLTPFLPAPGKATGAAVILAPGGAFMTLSMSHEGWKVAQKLADRGIAAFVLKYRVNETPADEKAFAAFASERMQQVLSAPPAGPLPDIKEPRATEDALAALRYVRQNAAKWNVDPHRVGMMGFSAGAMTTMNAVLEGSSTDRPAFIGYIYGPMLPVTVPPDAPPMFAAIAMDDELFSQQGFGVIESWRKAGRPVEFHAYERGNHGFGAGWPGTTTVLLIDEFVAWLNDRGLLKQS